jgi:hypothetical protein
MEKDKQDLEEISSKILEKIIDENNSSLFPIELR